MAIDALMRDKALTVRMIREIAAPEMRFIVRSGLLFGFVLGIVQAVIWAFTHSALIMPLFGAFVGYSTDWLAVQMVFRPIEPKRYLGVFRWQGLFHKRRDEVAVDYGGLIANEILTPANIIHAMLTGPQSARLPDSTQQIEEYTMQALDVYAMITEKMRLMTNDEYENILRPAFKQDEWKIVTVGAILGFLVGELQVLLLLH